MFIGYRNLARYIQKIRKNFRSIFVFVFTFKARRIKLLGMPFRSRNHALFYLTEHLSCSWNNLFAYKHSIQIQVREPIERGPRWLVYAALHSNGVMRHGNQRIVAKNGAYERIKVKKWSILQGALHGALHGWTHFSTTETACGSAKPIQTRRLAGSCDAAVLIFAARAFLLF